MQARHEEIQRAGAEVVAISSSAWESHAALAAKIGAKFPILSDPEGQ